jgi:hypothetical protein
MLSYLLWVLCSILAAQDRATVFAIRRDPSRNVLLSFGKGFNWLFYPALTARFLSIYNAYGVRHLRTLLKMFMKVSHHVEH